MLGTRIHQVLSLCLTVLKIFMVSVTTSRIVSKLDHDCFQLPSSLSFISDPIIQEF